jgi:hypothetical protein
MRMLESGYSKKENTHTMGTDLEKEAGVLLKEKIEDRDLQRREHARITVCPSQNGSLIWF